MQPPIDSAEEGAAAEDIDSLLSEVSAGRDRPLLASALDSMPGAASHVNNSLGMRPMTGSDEEVEAAGDIHRMLSQVSAGRGSAEATQNGWARLEEESLAEGTLPSPTRKSLSLVQGHDGRMSAFLHRGPCTGRLEESSSSDDLVHQHQTDSEKLKKKPSSYWVRTFRVQLHFLFLGILCVCLIWTRFTTPRVFHDVPDEISSLKFIIGQ